jgi:hypothetical protein
MTVDLTPLSVTPAMIAIAAASARTGQHFWNFSDKKRTKPPHSIAHRSAVN